MCAGLLHAPLHRVACSIALSPFVFRDIRGSHLPLSWPGQTGFSKVYRYDQNIEPPVPPVPGNPVFASPKGYKFDLVNGESVAFPATP